jgi:hypothetical protein
VGICVQSKYKNANKSKTIFSFKNSIRVYKHAEFQADLKSGKKDLKNVPKKLLAKK